ncbi:hypothetical protein PVK06_049043 [Gossypium arboreum]|uniref:Uncharacterized protein n=1 Tax=Gossypium arboreum TaxID=29729 RepID=A0ABR0MHM9_GOSAR|nr:hypothetical protein PVK06_049043 [Gossypium arboreum]
MVPYAQIGLARVAHTTWPKTHMPMWQAPRVAHTATLTPSHGHVLRKATFSSTTRSYLTHGQPQGQAHARSASTDSIFGFRRSSVFGVRSTHLVRF